MKTRTTEEDEQATAPEGEGREGAPRDERRAGTNKPPELSRKDILAVILALFQLFLPAIVGLILVGIVVALVLH